MCRFDSCHPHCTFVHYYLVCLLRETVFIIAIALIRSSLRSLEVVCALPRRSSGCQRGFQDRLNEKTK